MTYLVEEMAELRRHLDHLRTLRPRVTSREALERDLSLHNYGAGAREDSTSAGGQSFSFGPPSPSWKTRTVPVTDSRAPAAGALERLITVTFLVPSRRS